MDEEKYFILLTLLIIDYDCDFFLEQYVSKNERWYQGVNSTFAKLELD